MSLTDLKRKSPKRKPKSVSIDDFIEDANNYAQGKKSVIRQPAEPVNHSSKDTVGLNKNTSKLYRHATFSLTEHAILQLEQLHRAHKLPKSKLIRILIDDFHRSSLSSQSKLLNKKI
ncbi:replication protein RepA [Shewanella intestini]|uniref:Replication protein RepA n=1 Tax=Shewanella intestini TaxID=2017544 RepID=A0ABS5I4I7_9GAMM|nr:MULTISPECIES: replication protein RepA [Shewanella]MBR9728941.1 replication protein RepA [Shewanella intestini]MRG36994.1 replication protein RepA [Shewanella sp. XMDDZSB0408]